MLILGDHLVDHFSVKSRINCFSFTYQVLPFGGRGRGVIFPQHCPLPIWFLLWNVFLVPFVLIVVVVNVDPSLLLLVFMVFHLNVFKPFFVFHSLIILTHVDFLNSMPPMLD